MHLKRKRWLRRFPYVHTASIHVLLRDPLNSRIRKWLQAGVQQRREKQPTFELKNQTTCPKSLCVCLPRSAPRILYIRRLDIILPSSMKHRNKQALSKSVVAVLAVLAVCLVAFVAGFLYPLWNYVEVQVGVNNSSIEIEKCAFVNHYLLQILPTPGNSSAGNLVVVMNVYSNQTLISSTSRSNVGVGNCILDSQSLSGVKGNSTLTIDVLLYSSTGSLIAQNETNITYP